MQSFVNIGTVKTILYCVKGKGKGKGKVHLITGHEGPEVE
jgi:hypothetical protein